MKKLIVWFTVFWLGFAPVIGAEDAFSVNTISSMGAQRLNLENSIREKIADVLDSIITKDAYTIDVLIETSDPQRPAWYQRDGEPAKKKSKKEKADKAEAKKVDEQLKKEEEKEKSERGKIRFVDDNEPVDEGSVIIFDKLGIEAPLIDDFNDFQPDGKIMLTMKGGQEIMPKKEEPKKEVLNEVEEKVAFADQMWKFQNAIDIFNNLQKVKIEIGLSSALSMELRSKIESYIKKINFNLGRVKPEIKFNYILLGNDLKQSDWSAKLWKFFELLGKYATFLGLVVSMIIFAFFSNKLLERYFALMKENGSSDAMNIEMNAPERDEDSDDKDDIPEGRGGGGEVVPAGIAGFDGLKRFREYRDISPADAVILIKRWIAENSEQGKQSLKALVQRMEMKELEEIFTELSVNEKKKWQALMTEPLNMQDLAVANDYISNQIVQNIILPSYLDDKEVFSMIYQLTPEQVVELIAKNKKAGAALINVLNTNFVMNVFKKCPEDIKIGLVNQAMMLKPEDIKASQDNLKMELTKFVNTKTEAPFFDKIAQLIPVSLDINFESHLYSLLAKEKAFSLIKEISEKYFPASLIAELPETMLKELLQNYPLQKKVRLFLTLDDELRDELMAIFAPAGTKAHDMLEMEFENIKSNEQEFNRILGAKDEYWSDFVHYVRKSIKSTKHYANEARNVVNEWSDALMNGKKADLKLAA